MGVMSRAVPRRFMMSMTVTMPVRPGGAGQTNSNDAAEKYRR